MDNKIKIQDHISPKDFKDMRISHHWKDISFAQAQYALEHSMYVVGVYEEDTIIAMGRLVGDGTFKAMLTDVLVKPGYQGNGYGGIVVRELIRRCEEGVKEGEKMCIEGNPTPGNQDFYVHCGMVYDPSDQDGVFLWIEK